MPPTLDGERVDRAVALLTGWSRADVQALLARDAIVVDGRPVGKSHRLVAGTVIEVLDEPAVGAPPVGDAGGGRRSLRRRRRDRGRQTGRASSCTPAPVTPTAPS